MAFKYWFPTEARWVEYDADEGKGRWNFVPEVLESKPFTRVKRTEKGVLCELEEKLTAAELTESGAVLDVDGSCPLGSFKVKCKSDLTVTKEVQQ